METKVFSGMGNSAAVAARLSELLKDDDSTDLLWVFPVYAWGIPPVVVRHIESKDLAGRRCHMVCTYGDEAGMIECQWKRLIESRGGVCGGIYGVQMPNTYVCLPGFNVDSHDLAARKVEAAKARIDEIAEHLKSGEPVVDIFRGPLPSFKSRIIYPIFFKRLMKVGKFHHTLGCTACGRCIRLCPMSNITASADGTPCWGKECAFCLRCYHICPNHAVAYGSATARKGQYLNPEKRLPVDFTNI